jgi:hypothetical protein
LLKRLLADLILIGLLVICSHAHAAEQTGSSVTKVQDPAAPVKLALPPLRELPEIWAKSLSGGDVAVALFNRGASRRQVSVRWSEVGLNGQYKARDLWKSDQKLQRRGAVVWLGSVKNYKMTRHYRCGASGAFLRS